MPPKHDNMIGRPYGLTDSEMKVSLSVLRLLAIDGNTPIDKAALARLTGHEKPNSAVKIWSMAKAKLIAEDAAGPSNAATPSNAVPDTPATKPAKRGRKAKGSTGRKPVVADADDDADDDEDGDVDELRLEEPAPKRRKNKAGKKVKKEVKQELEDDSM